MTILIVKGIKCKFFLYFCEKNLNDENHYSGWQEKSFRNKKTFLYQNRYL